MRNYEDLSDREMARLLGENNAAKWFCGFSLTEKTPDLTAFCRFRALAGIKACTLSLSISGAYWR